MANALEFIDAINDSIAELEALRAELQAHPEYVGNDHWRDNAAAVGYRVETRLSEYDDEEE